MVTLPNQQSNKLETIDKEINEFARFKTTHFEGVSEFITTHRDEWLHINCIKEDGEEGL